MCFFYFLQSPRSELSGSRRGILTHNKGSRMVSTGEETHYKRMGGEVVNRPQLPQHQGNPWRKKEEEGSQVRGGCGEGQNTLLSSMAQFPTLTGLESSLESAGNAEHNRFYTTTKCFGCQQGCECRGGLWRVYMYVCSDVWRCSTAK